ncbi:MAG: hypothetical protein ACTSRG_02980 [Candidatus Helarchaeota archaeon]
MSNKKFKCAQCGENTVPIKVVYKHRKSQYIFVLKCLKHKTKLKIDENEIDEYLVELFNNTTECQYCGASGNFLREVGNQILEEFLTISKFCEKCKRHSTYRIHNILYSRFFDLYFRYFNNNLQPQKVLERKKDMVCSLCGNPLIVEKISISKQFFKKNIVNKIDFLCAGPERHKVQLEIPYNENDWLKLLPELINICDFCKSPNIMFKELNFYLTAPEFNSNIYDRELVKICKNCRNVKKIIIPHHYYELYYRFMKEKDAIGPDSTEISCPICKNEVVLDILKVKDLTLFVSLLCKEMHKTKLELEIIEKQSWIQTVLSIMGKCPKCWSSNQKLIAIKIKWPWRSHGIITEHNFIFLCKNCNNKRKLLLNNILFNEFLEYMCNKSTF